jgi:LuxR family maltose regulon positive regulatory protein
MEDINMESKDGALDGLDKLDIERLCIRCLENQLDPESAIRLITSLDISPSKEVLHLESWPRRIKIYTLGIFRVLINDEPIVFTRKSQKMPLALLKALVGLGGTHISTEMLAEMLWPDAEGDDAKQSLATTLHRLRKIIGHEAVIQNQGLLTLSETLCWSDLNSFDHYLSKGSQYLAKGHLIESWKETEKALHLYKGGFLQKDSISPWSLSIRERTRRKLLHHIERLSTQLQRAEKFEYSIDCDIAGINIDDLQEIFYYGLIYSYEKLGMHTEALSVYKQCHHILTTILGTTPSKATQSLVGTLPQGLLNHNS